MNRLSSQLVCNFALRTIIIGSYVITTLNIIATRSAGATLVYGGNRIGTSGLFFSPTIFTDVADSMWIAEEESFGPIMIISKFPHGDIDGVIDRANNTEFGLASGVFTKVSHGDVDSHRQGK